MASYNELKRKAHLLSTIISEIKTQASAVTVQIKDVVLFKSLIKVTEVWYAILKNGRFGLSWAISADQDWFSWGFLTCVTWNKKKMNMNG